MSYRTVSFIIKMRTSTGAGNSREHWGRKAARTTAERDAVVATWPRAFDLTLPVHVALTRVSPGRPDDDNAGAGMKSVRDAIAAQLGVDDGDRASVTWGYGAPRRGAWAVEVRIRERPGTTRRPAVPRPPTCAGCAGAKTADGQVHCYGSHRARGCRCWCAKARRAKPRDLGARQLLAQAGVLDRLHLQACQRGGPCAPGCPQEKRAATAPRRRR